MNKKAIKWCYILFGIGVGFIVLILLAWGCLILKSYFREPAEPEVFTGREDILYKYVTVDEDGEEHTIVHNGLLVFPEEHMDSIDVKDYYFSYVNGFNPCYEIFLEYQLDEQEFEKEKTRIENISLHYEGMVQDIVHVPDACELDAYVAAWGWLYEYALIDEENNRIICVYVQVYHPKRWNYIPEEYRLDTSVLGEYLGTNVVDEQTADNFTIYYFVGKDGRRIVRSQEKGPELY